MSCRAGYGYWARASGPWAVWVSKKSARAISIPHCPYDHTRFLVLPCRDSVEPYGHRIGPFIRSHSVFSATRPRSNKLIRLTQKFIYITSFSCCPALLGCKTLRTHPVTRIREVGALQNPITNRLRTIRDGMGL